MVATDFGATGRTRHLSRLANHSSNFTSSDARFIKRFVEEFRGGNVSKKLGCDAHNRRQSNKVEVAALGLTSGRWHFQFLCTSCPAGLARFRDFPDFKWFSPSRRSVVLRLQ